MQIRKNHQPSYLQRITLNFRAAGWISVRRRLAGPFAERYSGGPAISASVSSGLDGKLDVPFELCVCSRDVERKLEGGSERLGSEISAIPAHVFLGGSETPAGTRPATSSLLLLLLPRAGGKLSDRLHRARRP